MDGPADTNSLKNQLLEMGFQKNVIKIALWQANSLEDAIQCIYDIDQNYLGKISPKEYNFSLLCSMGYPLKAASEASKKSSLKEALDFLNNPQEPNKKNVESKNVFSKAIDGLYSDISKKVKNLKNNLFSKDGPIEKYAIKLKKEGENFETAFKKISKKIIGKSPKKHKKESAPHLPIDLQMPDQEEKDAPYEAMFQEQININENFPVEVQFAAWEEELNNEEEKVEEEEKEDTNEDEFYQYISAETINVGGNAIHAASPLDIMNILENFYNPKGISESNMKKLREIKYQAGTSPECCIICMEAFKSNERLQNLPCNHWFHDDCIMKWLNMSAKCPLDLLDI